MYKRKVSRPINFEGQMRTLTYSSNGPDTTMNLLIQIQENKKHFTLQKSERETRSNNMILLTKNE